MIRFVAALLFSFAAVLPALAEPVTEAEARRMVASADNDAERLIAHERLAEALEASDPAGAVAARKVAVGIARDIAKLQVELTLLPDLTSGQLQIGAFSDALSSADRALELAERTRAPAPLFLLLNFQRARALGGLDQFDEAVVSAKLALSFADEDRPKTRAGLHKLIGALYRKAGNLGAAADAIRTGCDELDAYRHSSAYKALAMPHTLYEELGDVEAELGRKTEARTAYGKAKQVLTAQLNEAGASPGQSGLTEAQQNLQTANLEVMAGIDAKIAGLN